MLSLTDRLRERIRLEGPITFHEWMKVALYDSELGYYCRPGREKWGRAGDYRTSAERSVLFAATFARYFAKLYEQLGSPAAWSVVEVGAGAGHFAEGVLETLRKRFQQIFSATRYIIDEASLDSRSRSSQQLQRFGEQVQFKRLEELEPMDAGIIFSNELLDAFPVHRVTMQAGELREFFVGLNSGEDFEWVIAEPSTGRLVEHFGQLDCPLVEGQVAEANLGIEDWFRVAAAKLTSGYIVTVDYGAEASELYDPSSRCEGTLRAFHRHRIDADVLARPGEQDITSSIDWTFVKRNGARFGLESIVFERQDRFLLTAGLLEELEMRVHDAADESERLRLRTSAREMILPGGMATSFQVLVQKKSDPES
jgi:SAM-dependent MidA family methyltransferase